LTTDFDEAQSAAEYRAALYRANRQIMRLKEKEVDLVEAVHQGAKDAALSVGRPGPVPRPSRDRRRSPEVALLHLTDWQLGKKSQTYSSEVCERRIHEAVRKTIKLTEIQRKDHPVRECVVLLGGDMVEGVGIFPGQPYEVDSTSFEQLFRAAGLIESVLLTLLAEFEKVTVYDVPGNHGRLGKRGDYPREDNLDRIVYRIAHDRLDKQTRLEWETGETWYRNFEIGSYQAMLVHGDQIKSFGGNVPAFGILRKGAAWAAGAVPEPFNDLYIGHMHQPMTLQLPAGGCVYMTPSTESSSAYAREFVGAHGRPGQRLHFVHPERGRVTAQYLLDLDD
jgi:hypothetical protein